ncbi:MAG: glycogen-binding domain-containing protein [Victivallaceae bacterium]|nr:glycogen-binding domain-containing protein [Victivallaceae bacterium]
MALKKTKNTKERAAKRRVGFTYEGPAGRKVCVAGSFNDWDPACKQLEYKSASGVYTGILMLEPGSYEYKFVVDGEWQLDVNNPNFAHNDFGSLNSMLVVE